MGGAGRLIITNFAPEMATAARRRAEEMGVKNAEFRVLDAEQMNLEAGSVDGVLCHWGYMLMVDPAAAFAETRCVVRTGGRLAFSVGVGPERNPWASLVDKVLVARAYVPPPEPEEPGVFAMADPGRIRELVTGAGFTEPEIEEVFFRWPFDDQNAYWRFLTETAGPTSPVLRVLPPETQVSVWKQVHEAARPFHSGRVTPLPAVSLHAVTHY